MIRPAFILGNGPTLPDDLSALDGQFTIGVNRILASGFTPTAVVWCDREVWEEQRNLIENSEALLMTTIRSHPRRSKRHYLLTLGKSCQDRGDAARLYASGSTGTAAARLALALGFDPVFCLGMGSQYAEDGRSNFYGMNARHNSNVCKTFAREVEALQRAYPHRIWRTDDRAVWKLGEERMQEDWRARLDAELVAAGVEVQEP